ncbi:MAG: LPXTG cell wall anchor domain-containing protein [Candidatus Altiarchaeota archaeon]
MKSTWIIILGLLFIVVGFFGAICAFIIGGLEYTPEDPDNPAPDEEWKVAVSDIIPTISLVGTIIFVVFGLFGGILLVGGIVFRFRARKKDN